ncbi:MAG: transglycosylase SLT domain-containing protein [Burkholderiales bacterium]|nr:transglycosylase SLT domain-containing protein [Burkholderiales bacterium]
MRRLPWLHRLCMGLLPVLLAACGSAPVMQADPLARSESIAPVPAPPAARPAAEVTPEEVLQEQIGNVDLRARQAQDLWQRMRNGFAIPELASAAVQERTGWYAARPEYLRRSFERARPFLFHIVEEIEKRGMPTELALLPLVESAYNPRAVSPAQAAGMWQFIPSTGKLYNLQQDWWRDDRRDIVASTTAALDYLQKLHGMFQDWHLALAAYNWGEGAVSRAIEKARAKGEPTDYANLRMPAETAGYVPKLQAIKNIVMRPELFGLALPEVPNAPYIATITKTRDIDVKMAAKLAEMPVDEFVALNPSHNRPVIPGANRPTLVLPADKVETFRQNLESHQDKPLSSWQAYLLKAGETLDRVAARFGIELSALKAINGLAGRTRVGAGQTLLVPRQDSAPGNALPARIERPAAEPEVRTVRATHVVQKGETLMAVARKFRLPVAEIKRSNKLSGDSVRPGQRLIIETTAVVQKPGTRGAVLAKAGKPGKAGKAKLAAKGKARKPVRLARR